MDATRRRILAMLRQSDIETSAGPHPLLALARGVCVGEHLLRRMPDADGDLQRAIGLTFEDYFSIVASVAAMSLCHSIADFKTPEKNGVLSLGTIEQGTTPFGRLLRSYFSHESQSPDELRRALWQERTDSEESGASRFLFTPLRAKPLLKTRGDQAVIIDPTLFAERPTAGPLFHLARGKRGGQANRLFAAFGDAFEDYVRDVMQRIFREGNDTPLARRYVHNPTAIDKRGNKVELADGLLLEHDVAVLLEAKAVWIKEDLASPDADPGRYIEHLRERYGVSAQSKPGDRPVKGLGQLARAIKGLSEGALVPRDATFAGIRRVLPVLLVHDGHLNAGTHPHFLAEEFVSALGRNEVPERWRELQIGPFQVAHLLVLTVEDIELLETSSDHFSVVTCFNEYASRSPDRMTSFYNFLVTSEFREKVRYSRWLESKQDALLDRAVQHLSSFDGS